ncbi:MAG: hypothetical protein HY820_40455, partial [Acidobacteria bacterium]|nr:hypothetical protein [Acidobacteriota bacterium]MBI4909961.1 hypothetical protein [Acidobacteriota bacterium]
MQKTDFRLFSPVHFVILALILGVAFGLTKIVRARPDAAWLIR